MNIHNFYILIFNYKIKFKIFINLFFIIIVILLITSLFSKLFINNISANNIIKDYQIEKISSNKFKNVNTIFVGDSSGGNAINSSFFNELSGLKSENLCLTGSWGIVGSLGIIKKAYIENPNIKNIIIIQTLNIWNRSYPKESIFKLFQITDWFEYITLSEILKYYLNFKEIFWNLKKIFSTDQNKNNHKIDLTHDYLLQNEKKYSNGMKEISKNYNMNKVKVSEDKKKELNMLENFCKENSLNCLFLNGPIHYDIIENSRDFIQYKINVIDNQFLYIKYFPNIISYKNNEMGDSADHIDVKIKNKSTLDYYELIKNDLIF